LISPAFGPILGMAVQIYTLEEKLLLES